MDGLKTGYTKDAGYCLTSTAKKNNMRLITVVMNEPTPQIRNSETTSMLDYGFNMYNIDVILEKDTVIKEERVELGKEEKIQIIPTEDVKILNSNNKEKRDVTYNLKLNNIVSPIKKGDIVGKIEIIENGKTINVIDATVKYDVDRANLFIVYYRNLKKLFRGF